MRTIDVNMISVIFESYFTNGIYYFYNASLTTMQCLYCFEMREIVSSSTVLFSKSAS